jgi:hypothetical protein
MPPGELDLLGALRGESACPSGQLKRLWELGLKRPMNTSLCKAEEHLLSGFVYFLSCDTLATTEQGNRDTVSYLDTELCL